MYIMYTGHCDLIVQAKAERIWISGENAGDSVTRRPIALTAAVCVPSTNQGGESLLPSCRPE